MKTADLELTTLKKGLRQLELAVAKIKPVDDRDAFKRQMSEYCVRAIVSFAELEKSFTECKQVYAAVLVYFGEDPNLPAEEFFKNWNAFLLSFVRAREEVRKTRERKQKQQEQQARMATPHSPCDRLVDDIMANVEPSTRKRTVSIAGSANTPPWLRNKAKPSAINAAAKAANATPLNAPACPSPPPLHASSNDIASGKRSFSPSQRYSGQGGEAMGERLCSGCCSLVRCGDTSRLPAAATSTLLRISCGLLHPQHKARRYYHPPPPLPKSRDRRPRIWRRCPGLCCVRRGSAPRIRIWLPHPAAAPPTKHPPPPPRAHSWRREAHAQAPH